MFRYNLILFFRNIKRDKTTFAINLFGLSSALVCVLLIYLWVNDEMKMDKFNKNDKQLYKVMFNLSTSQEILTLENTPAIMAEAMVKDFPEVKRAVAVNDFLNYGNKEGVISFRDNKVSARGRHAGKDYFNVFSIDLLYGNKENVLCQKDNIVISQSLAKKLFKNPNDCIGKSLRWEHTGFNGDYTISGVFKNPRNTSMEPFDVIFSLDILFDNDRWAGLWTGCYAQTFVVLEKNTNVNEFNTKIKDYLLSKNPRNDNSSIFLQRYSQKYLYGQYKNGFPTGGRIAYVRIFTAIAFFIMLIAAINYINLSTAKISGRLKEIGVKKSIGAKRKTILIQYISEAIILSFLALIIACAITIVILPQYNVLVHKNLSLFDNGNVFAALLAITCVVGFLSGSYPALYISGFKPVSVLKGKFRTSSKEKFARNGLVVFQFTLSIVFILLFIVLNKQMQFVQNKNLGYNNNNIISFKWKGDYEWRNWDKGGFDVFVSELKKLPGVANTTSMSGNILNNVFGQGGVSWSGKESEREFNFQSPVVGYNFIETLGIELKQGRTFSSNFNDDYSKIILNESAVKLMGFENPVGQYISMNGSSEIIGVVKDFHYGSLHKKIEPLILRFEPFGQNILVKIHPDATINTLEQIEKLHAKFYPNYAFEFTFLNDDYQALYESESRISILSRYFAVIAIIISCLGLYGLISFSAQRRSKEIGIRKVHGSTAVGIVQLLSGDFTKLIILAVVFALPISLYLINKWLMRFAYTVELEWWYFGCSGLLALVIAWATIAFQAFKAANTNPAKVLNDE